MALASDLRVLFHLVFSRGRGATHEVRLANFYAAQANDYDSFRERLLKGRREMIERLAPPAGGTWIDLGGGTAANLEFMDPARLASLSKVIVVDLCEPLLRVAAARVERNGWRNVELVHADATTWAPDAPADAVSFSYSLTMIPDWFAAIDHARELLRPGGRIGVVDFHVSRKRPEKGLARHGAFTRVFWPAWFAQDDVNLSPDHLPYLRRRFDTVSLEERRARVPYLPASVPHYVFVGKAR